MKVSNFLVSTVATAAVVSAIGLAYAQTTGAPMSSGPESSASNPQGSVSQESRPSAGMSDNRSSAAGNVTNDGSSVSSDRLPRADRN